MNAGLQTFRDPLADLWRLAQRGTRPVGPVFLTDSWKRAELERSRGMWARRVDWSKPHDWRTLAGLDVIAVGESTVDSVEAWQSILAVNPRRLVVNGRLVVDNSGVKQPDPIVYEGDENLQLLVDACCAEMGRTRVVIR